MSEITGRFMPATGSVRRSTPTDSVHQTHPVLEKEKGTVDLFHDDYPLIGEHW